MGKILWEVVKVGGALAALCVLLALGGGTGTGRPRRYSGGEPRARIYRPTGGTRGFGTRGYEHHR